MAINPNLFIHEADKAALNALKSVPGFSTVLKAFMNVWNEKQFKIRNMSTNLRLSEEQLPKYYNMLPPICEKLGIDIPELYLELDVRPNAYTSGDTNPFIVITSGLLETMPEELIPTIIAHECGHIACRHVLYRTMGKIILSGAIAALGIPGIAILPIQAAFAYWMRCSEYSADRAAVICDGDASKMAEVCARFAGFDKHVQGELNMEAFLNQAVEYNEMMSEDQWNKTLELLMYSYNTHPLNAVRAYECLQWEKSDQFIKVKNYIENNDTMDDLPLEWSDRTYLYRDYREVEKEIRNYGFTNIKLSRVIEKPGFFTKENQTLQVTVNDKIMYEEGDWVPISSKIVITYYSPLTEEELIKLHPGERRMPNSSRYYSRRYVDDVINELYSAGFTNIKVKEVFNGNERLSETVNMISINGKASFSRDEWFSIDSEIVIFVNKFI